MNLQDALFNWLQIKVVSDARKDDNAAKETLDFFETILREDHHLSEFGVERVDETMYHVRYEADGKRKTQFFDRELVDQLLADINSNPKYND
ncbi:hypothetical protein [Paenibacillus hamazuiensis]|uniref:hypothetical protein n=1 Tax=Paenibacillus hamazuiensis TaxID=2936508 RepID=UPI00200FC76A|nr:hypothetical protein [Paenibacillus hamazuiensis]